MHWYNDEHHHSGIRYVNPAQRHDGRDGEILERRHVLYLQARERNPRPWSRIDVVTLNPERHDVAKAAVAEFHKQQLIA